MDERARAEWDRQRMAEKATEKVWTVPTFEGSGPVTMTLRIPDVTITDSAGRYIVISPRQTAIVGARLDRITDWLQYGAPEDDVDE
jgi:hypothetical protein